MCYVSPMAVLNGHKSARGPYIGYRNDRFFSHTNPYISNVTQQCRCSPMLIFRAWATCALIHSFQMEGNNVKMRLQCFYSAVMASRSRNWTIQIKSCSRFHGWYKYPPCNCDLNEARPVQIYRLKNNSDTIKAKREKKSHADKIRQAHLREIQVWS